MTWKRSKGVKNRSILALSECQHGPWMADHQLRPPTPHGPQIMPGTRGATVDKDEQVRHRPSLNKLPKSGWRSRH